MKNLHAVLLVMGAVFCFMLFAGNSGGRTAAGSPWTGAPSTMGGTEGVCGACHSGGASVYGEPVLTWTIADANGNNITSYVPGQKYNVTLAVTVPDATTAPAAYGFSAIFLDDTEAPDGGSAQTQGTFDNFSAEANAVPYQGRTYVEQNQRTASGVWTFDWTAPAAGSGEVRIYSVGNAVNGNFGTSGDSGSSSSTIITLQEAATLPIALARFEARTEKNSAVLNWRTDFEENASHFELERSRDGVSFDYVAEIATKARSGGASYAYTDADLADGTYFYRLRMEDLDGSFAYSSVVTATVAGGAVVNVWPNPASTTLNISSTAEGVSFRLLNANGGVVRDNLTNGRQDISGLARGLYLLETTDASGRSVQRVIKQ